MKILIDAPHALSALEIVHGYLIRESHKTRKPGKRNGEIIVRYNPHNGHRYVFLVWHTKTFVGVQFDSEVDAEGKPV